MQINMAHTSSKKENNNDDDVKEMNVNEVLF